MKRWQQLIIVVALILLGAGLRIWQLSTLPPGFNDAELASLSITEDVRVGQIVVFSATPDSGQATFFQVMQALITSITGDGLLTLRMISIWGGLLTLATVYALARRLYSERAALFSLALMAVGFWPILLSRLSLREALLPLFVSSVLLALTNGFHIRRTVSPDPPTTTAFAALGILIAVGLYDHWYGLLLVASVTIIVAYLYTTRQQISRRAAGASAFAILLSLIVTIPYTVTTFRYPSISGFAALRRAMMPGNILESFFNGIAGFFLRGDLNPAFNIPGRPLLDPITGLLFVAGLVIALRNWRRPSTMIPAIAALIGLIPILLSTESSSFLSYAAILPLIYLVAASAADDLLLRASPQGPALNRAAPLLMAALVIGNLLWTGNDLFNRWPARDDVKEAFHANQGLLANYLERTASEIPTVVCSPYMVDTDERIGDPRMLDLMTQRDKLVLRYVDCANGLILAEGGAEQQIAFTDPGAYARVYDGLRQWLDNGESIAIEGLPENSVLKLSVQAQLEDTVGRMMTTAPTGWAPESPGGAGSVALPVRFGDNLTFLGYDPIEDTTYAPGDVVPLLTYWRVDGPIPPDVIIFTHLLSDPAAIVAQSSALNVWMPTLRNRDVFIQVSYVVLPESIPAGSYDFSIGAYHSDTSERLPVLDGEQMRGDRLFLYQITVSRED